MMMFTTEDIYLRDLKKRRKQTRLMMKDKIQMKTEQNRDQRKKDSKDAKDSFGLITQILTRT